MQRRRVGVIFGGRSVEHDVSIVTAHQAMEVLRHRYEVVPIYITREGRWLHAPELFDLSVYKDARWDEVGEPVNLAIDPPARELVTLGGGFKRRRKIPVDVIVPAVHGTNGEDGTLQGLLELAGVPYTGSGVVPSAVGMDKVAMKAAFRAAGLAVGADHVVEVSRLDRDADGVLDEVSAIIGYPAFVKPARAGSSVGIARADDRDGLKAALEVARNYDRRILVEKAMADCIEVNCSVLGGAGFDPLASACEQPVPWEEFLTFSDKYMRSSKTGKAAGMATQERILPAQLPDAVTKQVQENAIRAFRAIDAAGVARVDSFVNEATGESWVMEINTMPGSFSFYLWEESGLSFDQLMDKLLQIAFSAHEAKGELLFTFDSEILDTAGGSKGGDSGRE